MNHGNKKEKTFANMLNSSADQCLFLIMDVILARIGEEFGWISWKIQLEQEADNFLQSDWMGIRCIPTDWRWCTVVGNTWKFHRGIHDSFLYSVKHFLPSLHYRHIIKCCRKGHFLGRIVYWFQSRRGNSKHVGKKMVLSCMSMKFWWLFW